MSDTRKVCPFFGGKIDRYDGVGIDCDGSKERYESEFERDAWCAMRCECEDYVKCDVFDNIAASGIGQAFSPD